ncbi:MAG: flagellar motor protein MotB [Lachnospiraceae bacterium]|nr:flagellar motor protein MotB [Lachnospiraceae bacterium]MBP3507220.1 flagellar motor protein MotB [Lachnospiraceae bacterium]
MAKRREEQPDEGSPAWMSTFSDLMNLLLCFFVLLFASSTMDEGKIQQIAASFQNISFSIFNQTTQMVQNGQMVSGGVTQLQDVNSLLEQVGKAVDNSYGDDSVSKDSNGQNPESSENGQSGGATDAEQNENLSMEQLQEQVEQAGLEQSEEMYKEISTALESYTIDERVQIDYNYEYVELDMNGALLFDTGDAELKEESYVFMDKIGAVLETYKDSIIEIEGHTDNVPIHTFKYESNRYLSTARATNVYEYLMENADLIDENMKVAGYGESRPVASNETEEGRARNRRVVIKIYNQLSSSSQE